MLLSFVIVFDLCIATIFGSSQQLYISKLDDLDQTEAIMLSQSESCTDTDNRNRIQCFRQLPLAKYEVSEGEEVMIACRVAFQKGKLQWAFKGKMLGFDRDIPNYPRMRMPGNAEIGDHSLFIENVQVSDSGNYECQLSPSASQPPRRRLTTLVVLRAPMQPVIYREGVISKENISISIKKDETAFVINLTCVALDGNPEPSFEWRVNDNQLQSGSIFRSGRTQITVMNESTSVLSLRSDQITNNDFISCGVFNAATRKRIKLSERILTTRVRVYKQRPLRFKEMPQNINTITIEERESLRLSCMTNDPGEPPIRLSWKSNLSNYPINYEMITNTNSPTFSQSTITIPTIDAAWHRKSLICTGTQDGLKATNPISATILVKHVPKKIDVLVVSMTTNSTLENPLIVYTRENQLLKLICTTDTFYSENLKLVWLTKVSDEYEWKKVTTTSERMIHMDSERLILLESVLEITPSMLDISATKKETSKSVLNVVCIMKSPRSSGELRRHVKIEKYERSTSPVITINDERHSAVLVNGQSVKIKCSITGGHPTPDLHLVDGNDRELKARVYHQLSVSLLEYNIEVKHRDNGKKFRCTTSSKSTLDFVPLSSDLVTLTVAIPPQKLVMKIPESNIGYQADQYVSYSCLTDTSVPQAKIEWWWHHSCKIPDIKLSRLNHLSSSNIRPFCESRIIEDNHLYNFDAATQSSMSTVNIKLSPTYDLTFIECLVSPDPKWATLPGHLSQISQIRVQYLPQFPQQLENLYVVEEGQNISIAINATANPPINGYTWLQNKQAITRKSQIELKVDQFAVSNAQTDMMGNYTLLLENQLGKTSFSFFLNITFAPKLLGQSIETIKLSAMKEYKQKAVIMCSAQANPFREQAKVQWTREPPLVMDQTDLVNSLKGNNLFVSSRQVHCDKDQWSRSNISIDCISLGAIEIVSRLQIIPMDYRHIGSYKCIFSSNIKPSSALKTTHLVFPTAPVPIKNYRKSEYVAKLSGKTEIACYFIAYPTPNIVWFRSPNIRCADNSRKYATSVTTPQIGLVKAVLAIRETNDSDIGSYVCNAQNQYGKSSNSVLLGRSRPPTQPLNVTLVNVTDSSITIGWIPGFNGGSKQTIELRWRQNDIGRDAEFGVMEFGENEDSDVQFHIINDLQTNKEYEILVQATNRYTINPEIPIQLFVRTMKYEPDGEYVQSDSRRVFIKGNKGKSVQDKNDTNNMLIIILLSTIGGLLIGLKIGLIAYFIRRRSVKRGKSVDKMSSPTSQRMTDGYLNSADSMEMRAPSLIRSGIESNMYAHSMSDHLSQNGSDNGLKLSYYKSASDEFQSPYLSPELDLVASAMGRNNFNINGVPPNFHPAYIQLTDSSSLTGYPEPYLTGFYTHKPVYPNQVPSRSGQRTPNHSVMNQNALPQYPISSNYQKKSDNYPSSAVSMSTASGESNRSRSPNIKYAAYSPLIGQSGAPSTVEEYLSSANSGSEYHRVGPHGNEGYVANPMTSFRLNQKEYFNGAIQDQISTQESVLAIPSHKMSFDNGMDFHYSILDDRHRLSLNSESEQLLKPPMGFTGSINASPPPRNNEIAKLNYVDLISHSSPSVIRLTGTMSENL